jgi:hypothetical protein
MNTRRNRRNGTMRKQRGGAMSGALRSKFSALMEMVSDIERDVSVECGGGAAAAAAARPASARPVAAAAGAATRAVSRGRQPVAKPTNDLITNEKGRIRTVSTGRAVEMQLFLKHHAAISGGKMNQAKAFADWKEYKESLGKGNNAKQMTEANMKAFISAKLGKKANNGAGAAAGGGGAYGLTKENLAGLM